MSAIDAGLAGGAVPLPVPAGTRGAAGRILASAVALAGMLVLAGLQPVAAAHRQDARGPARTPVGHQIDPALFEPGACEEFPPSAGNHHTIVFLDAGHGGIDPGGLGRTLSGRSVEEAALTLPVELDTVALLRADGFEVVASRTRPGTVARPAPGAVSDHLFTVQGETREIAARDQCANMARAAALIGIYFDTGPSPTDAGSITGYDAARPFAAQNLRLATLVQTDVLAAMNARGWEIPNDGVLSDTLLGGPALSQAGDSYGHLLLLGPADPGYFATPSKMPGALIEPLFITDPFEGTIAASPAGQQTIARGIATAVQQYFAPPAGAAASRAAVRPKP